MQLWAGCSSDVKAAYGEEYKKQMQAGIGGISKLNNNDPSEVPKAYIHALTAQAPQFRYRCGKDSKIDITVLTWLPDSWQDALLRSKTASHIPAASSVAAMNRAIARYAQTTVVRKLVLLVLLIVGTVYAKKRLA
ncbi:hypothetical protein DIPPA_25292 [Diplonema papillatum]|nr:hypothetical protein DIPPA_25292 [Diplonema papillatum]